MAIHRSVVSKRRVWHRPDKPDCVAFPLRLMVVAKLRARRPITIAVIARIWSRSTTEPDLVAHPLAPLRPAPYPPHPAEPLVQPSDWKTLPKKLERPDLGEANPDHVALAQPGYKGLPLKHVRSCWSWMGYKPMGMYRKLYVDPPKTGLPEGYNLLMTDEGLAGCATHLFCVHAYESPDAPPDPAARRRTSFRYRREVDLYPTHAAIWAAYCARLPPIAPRPTKLKLFRDARPGAPRAASVLRLPIVPIAVPDPSTFWPIMRFVYTYRRSELVNGLLPCAKFKLPPDGLNDPPPAVWVPCYARALAETADLLKLCQIAKNVHGAWRNMLALGVVEDRMWDALQSAWDTVLAAMELAEKGVQEKESST